MMATMPYLGARVVEEGLVALLHLIAQMLRAW
jgi:hypothetical protein